MNKCMWGCVALLALVVVAESLKCKSCALGISSLCIVGYTTTCSASEPNCYTGTATFNVSSVLTLTHKSCRATSSCNNSSDSGSVLGAGYTITQACCSTDLCNGASSVKLPLTAVFGAALVAVWSSYGY